MTKKSQRIFAKGKAKALDSLFVGENAPFGYLAVGYNPKEDENGFEDPIENNNIATDPNDTGFKEIDSVQYNYERVPLELVDAADFQNIDYNTSTEKVTRTFQATLGTENIEGTYINQIAIVSNKNQSETDDFYSATTFNSFYKNQESSITFRISFTL